MPLTHIAIIILSVSILLALLLANFVDQKFYGVSFIDQAIASGDLFCTSTYEEPFNRFVLSKGGILLTLVLLSIEIGVGMVIR